MYYEFYIDQFAAEQFLSGTLLLGIASRLMGKSLRWSRILAGSIVSTSIMVLLICLGIPKWYPVSIVAAAAAAFYEGDRTQFAKGLCALLFVTVCFGGALEMVISILGVPAFAAVWAAGAFVYAMAVWWKQRRADEQVLLAVTLQWEDGTRQVRALLDTGNQLYEPLTGRPVSIMNAETAGQLLGKDWEMRRGFYLIPYHSLGTKESWMRGVTLDRLYVEIEGKTIQMESPIFAIYKGQVSAGGRYEVILHREHADINYKR